ncbi:SHOCT domain-containing protein, partial [Ramlibacter sp.]|uniref:SHOCT domain-containing protein n=1 Tax=Ramlibacter sp. TaxID=1917967 RepID=UPI002602B4C6
SHPAPLDASRAARTQGSTGAGQSGNTGRRAPLCSGVKGERTLAKVPRRPLLAQVKDLYSEMLKLDDLRKRGLLTDAEFNAEKARLLPGR